MTNNRSNQPASMPFASAPSARSGPSEGRREMWPQSYSARRPSDTPGVASRRATPPRPVGALSASRTSQPAQSAVKKLWMPLVAAVVVILAVVLVAGANRAGARSNRTVAPRMVTVVPGDTLWSIARSQKPTGDVRPLVSKIARLNNVGAQLAPGSTLVLP